MSSESEIQRLVVRLIGDTAGYESMLRQAQDTTSELGREMQRLGGSERDFNRVTQQAATAMGIAKEAMAKYNWEQRRLQGLLDAGRLKQETYNRKIQELRAATAPAVAAVAQHQALMQRGLLVTQSTENAVERYNRKLAENRELLNAGAISQETFNRTVRQAEAELKAGAAGSDQLGQSLMALGGGVRHFGLAWSVGVTAPIVGFLGASAAAAMKMQSLKLGLNAVAGSSEAADRQLLELREIAKLPGLGLEEAVQGSVRLQAVKLNANLANRAMKAFGNALATVGKGRNELQGVILAMTQIVGKGKVQMEEINQIAERVPQIRAKMEEAFGTSDTQALGKMGIKPEEFIEKITEAFEGLPPIAETAANTIENFKDTTFQAMVNVGDAVLTIMMPAINLVAAMVEKFAAGFLALPQWIKVSLIVLSGFLALLGPLAVGLGTLVVIAGQLSIAYTTLAASATFAAAATKALAVASIAAKVAMIGSVIVGIVAVSAAIYQAMPSVRAFNAELEKSAKLAGELASRDTKAANDVMQAASELSGSAKQVFLEKNIKESEKNLKGLEFQLQTAKKNAEDLKPTWLSMGQAGKKLWEAEEQRVKEIQERYSTASAHVVNMKKELENAGKPQKVGTFNMEALKANEAAKKLLKTMQATAATVGASSKATAIEKLAQAGGDKGLINSLIAYDNLNVKVAETIKKKKELEKAVHGVKEKLIEQAATAGMTTNQVQLYELRVQGATRTELMHVAALQKVRDARVLAADVSKMVKGLNDQAQTMFMSAEQTKLWELRQRGASMATLMYVAALQKRNAALAATKEAVDLVKELQTQIITMNMTTDQVKLYDLAQKGASRSVLATASALQQQKKLMEDSKAMIEKHKSPMAKFQDQYTNLRKMLALGVGQGGIDSTTFKKELELIEKELQDAQDKANINVTFTAGDNSAVRRGTKEFDDMILNTQKLLAERKGQTQVDQVKKGIDIKVASNPLIKPEVPKVIPPPGISGPMMPPLGPLPTPIFPSIPTGISSLPIPSTPPPTALSRPVPMKPSETDRDKEEKSVEKLLSRIAAATEGVLAKEPLVVKNANLGSQI